MAEPEPGGDCQLCPRLFEFRAANRAEWPDWYNAPVPSFGQADARLLVVGLAPGLKGANRTGRPFTGDYAGDLLYSTLVAYGMARGRYEARPDDGLTLIDARITNAVRCVPPENKPTTGEIVVCRRFLEATLAEMPRLEIIVALGRIAHDSTIRALGARPTHHPFGHGAEHAIGGRAVFDSYHCSRYNTNTGRLTAAMFHAVFAAVRARLDRAGRPAA
ncbi:uracil-DNA glycosylase [Blastochloris viridis]|uniref:Type-5 uracil-DNA glycosylase n=1 Tax=Blastochloris viridis TaxID=1079 RepID=A0A0H5BNR8_BLAVI|nr:uracil-DNA glycosylase [Blastochloris viridis]ALK08598.1 Uracil DNA glycosylase superfamily protein [Blastochloris viridis]BAR98113.1 uracil-DNA glycosylase [Blastochloris viridis]CUU41261.1 uracil-DNA glycosylase, family 4 [Blastochloris viridis]